MKKTITVFFIVILLLNLISNNSFATEIITVAYDDGPTTTTTPSQETEYYGMDNPADALRPQETSTTTVQNNDGQEEDLKVTGTTYSSPLTFKIIVNVLTVIPQTVNTLLELCVEKVGGENISKFTIYDTVMGNYEIFNIDYHIVAGEPTDASSVNEIVKYNVNKYYDILRNLSIALSLFILIYVGIRMAISTVASDKAKYGKMLYNWIASLFLVIFMHFIIIVICYLVNYGLGMVSDLANSIGITDIEKDMYSGAIMDVEGAKGFNVFTAFLVICLLSYYQLKFFIFYMLRAIEVSFLIVISPLVTITYSIDKVGDGEAQAFKAWLTELISKSSVQLIHAILYCIFIASAGVIATNHPLIAVLFLGLLTRTEKIVRNIFSIKEDGFQKAKVPFVD